MPKTKIAPPLSEEDKMQYNQDEARKGSMKRILSGVDVSAKAIQNLDKGLSAPHGQNERTKEMSKATRIFNRIRQLDAEYDALVGGKEGRKKSKASQEQMDADNRKRLEK